MKSLIQKKDLPGLILCLFIGTAAYYLGKMLPVIGGPVFAILLGMCVTLIFPKIQQTKVLSYEVSSGIKLTSKKVLQWAIILLGFEMNLFRVFEVGVQSLWVMVFTITAALLTAFIVGKLLKVNGKMTTLIGVGTAICGGSAIAATAPVIEADDESIAQAISTIFLFNIAAVFLFPTLGRLIGLSDIGFGMWAGTAVNDTSSVVATGVAWSALSGNATALNFATIVKLTRTLMIVPITLVLAYVTLRQKKEEAGSSFSFKSVFPWFVLGFLLTAAISTFLGLPAALVHGLVFAGKFMIIMAMSAIGLNTHLIKLLKSGFKPLLLGLCCWIAVASVSLVVQKAIGLL